MSTLHVRVATIRREAEGIASFELVSEDGGPLPAFEAGAHVDVLLPGLPARQYSLCNTPGQTHRYQIAVLKEPASRGGSRHMHEKINQGDCLCIGVPRNHFPLVADKGRALLVAGGIGITPLLAMAETLAARQADFTLHYCARSLARAAFADRLSAPHLAPHVQLHLDDGPEAQRLDPARVLAGRMAGDHLYICGPGGFLDWMRAAAAAAGWPEETVHTEYFSGTVEQRETDSDFQIEVQATGQIIHVAKGQTALDALLAAGLDVPNSCTEGVCGMCMSEVIDGTPDHRDQFLTAAERARGDTFMPCCSRAASPRLTISGNW